MKEWSSIGELFDHHRFQEYSKQEIYQVLLHSSGRRERMRKRRFEIGWIRWNKNEYDEDVLVDAEFRLMPEFRVNRHGE